MYIENRDNDYYSYEVIGNNFYIDCYNLSFDFVNCFLTCFGDCHLIFDSLIYYMNYFVIYCLDSYYFDCWSNFYFYCLTSFFFYYLNSFYFYCTMNFVIDCWNSVYFCLIGNWMLKQIMLSFNLIVGRVSPKGKVFCMVNFYTRVDN